MYSQDCLAHSFLRLEVTWRRRAPVQLAAVTVAMLIRQHPVIFFFLVCFACEAGHVDDCLDVVVKKKKIPLFLPTPFAL